MANEEILAELRTIRTLLALDKEKELNELFEELDEVEHALLEAVDNNWDSLPTADIASECGVGNRTVQRRANNLVDLHLLEKRREGNGTEFRGTGLLTAAEIVANT